MDSREIAPFKDPANRKVNIDVRGDSTLHSLASPCLPSVVADAVELGWMEDVKIKRSWENLQLNFILKGRPQKVKCPFNVSVKLALQADKLPYQR